ncbi:unnamed protein product [Spirodela intermedia]|uniref:Uncharacterized protein n=1 Tax=Spirodela intermedia TaxID=51605 RepID=A0ABN7ECW9_SPIIN|nr:unnamed protein product [Spirodela intermedia]
MAETEDGDEVDDAEAEGGGKANGEEADGGDEGRQGGGGWRRLVDLDVLNIIFSWWHIL